MCKIDLTYFILKCYIQCFVILWLLVFFMVKSSGIVITPGVLCDGNACKCGYDLVLCECIHQAQRIMIKPKEIEPGVSNLTIINCQTVQFQTGAIKNINSLRTINLRNIQRLELQEKSLEWAGDYDHTVYNMDFPRLSITIQNTKIPVITRYTFNGNIQEINFLSDTIGRIDPFGFSNLNGNEKLYFKNTTIDSIHLQGFKKFTTDILMFERSTVNSELISRTFSDIKIRKLFQISDHSSFKNIKTSAFIINEPLKFEITDSTFQTIESEAFRVQVSGDATFRDNYFDIVNPYAFSEITAKRRPRLDFIFANNTVNQIFNHSLDFNNNDFNVKLYTINLNIVCSCQNIQTWRLMVFTNDLRAIYCLDDKKSHLNKPINADVYNTKYCSTNNSKIMLIVIILVVIVILIILFICLFIYYRKQLKNNKQKEWINNASPLMARKYRNNTDSVNNVSSEGSSMKYVNGKLPIIVPDGRTYRETVLVVESADLLTTEL